MEKFVLSIKNVGNSVQISSAVEIHKGVGPATYYSELKEYLNKLLQNKQRKLFYQKFRNFVMK